MKGVRCYGRFFLLSFFLLFTTCSCAPDDGPAALFQDDFDNSSDDWGKDQRDEFSRGYADGVYFFELYEPNWFAWAYPGGEFEDVSVEMNTSLTSGAVDGHWGIMCRHTDLDNFYYFAISADGYYAIFRMDSGFLKIITGDGRAMAPSSAIRTGQQANHILAVCQGDELSLYVNDVWLDTVTDGTHVRGDVGLGAGSGPGGGFRVQFDDFVVTEP